LTTGALTLENRPFIALNRYVVELEANVVVIYLAVLVRCRGMSEAELKSIHSID